MFPVSLPFVLGHGATARDFAAIAGEWRAQQAAMNSIDKDHSASLPDKLLMDANVEFVGRVHEDTSGVVSFDMNGVQIKATVTSTTALYAFMSQVQKAQGNTFQVFLDGVIQPESRFNTSSWAAGQLVKVPLFPSRALAADASHAVTIVKDTEPQFAGTTV